MTALAVNGRSAITFGYDGDGLLAQVGNLTISRSATNGLLTGMALGPVTTSQSFSPFGELSHHTTSMSGATLFDVAYSRDALGRVSTLTETLGGIATTRGYTYDSAGRLAEVRENGTLTAVYEYDGNGNRLRVTRPSGVETGIYDDQDRLLSYGDATYTYSRSGELNTKTAGGAATHYEYDVLENLRQVTLADGTVIEYLVDGLDRRVGKKVNGLLVQGFLYRGQLNPVAELDGAGNVVSEFVYGTRTNVPEYMVRAGVTYRIVADHLGSVRLVVRATDGAVVQRLDYDEFGRVLINSAPGFQPFGYAGGLFDFQTTLVRFGVRDYDATVGRWTVKDPLGFAGGYANLYEYVDNNPLNAVDPSGEQGIILFAPPPFILFEQPPVIPPELIQEAIELNRPFSRVRLPDGREVDLKGKAHPGPDGPIKTPHVHDPDPPNPPPYDNFGPGNQDVPRKATKGDIEDAIKHLKDSKAGGLGRFGSCPAPATPPPAEQCSRPGWCA
jgi:RHS repeat-associated protein